MHEPREALADELTSRGYRVQTDTHSARGELYIMGDGGLATALFEFKRSVREAIDTMYQGAWVDGLPPRFAVLPTEATADPEYEMLAQVRIIPLLYTTADEGVRFTNLDTLDKYLPSASTPS